LVQTKENLNTIIEFLCGKRGHHRDVQEVLKKEVLRLIQELQNLNDNIALLTASVDAAVAKLGTPVIANADVQAAADVVAKQTAKLDAALTAPAP
jgi:predicted nucleic acid-binding protein